MPTKRAIGNVTASNELLEIAMSFGPSCVMSAAARLGVADALGDAERSASDVATACKADPASTYRLLRGMAVLGLLEETKQQHSASRQKADRSAKMYWTPHGPRSSSGPTCSPIAGRSLVSVFAPERTLRG
jgi:hypothetical protein